MNLCPIINKCEVQVSFHHYREFCANETHSHYQLCKYIIFQIPEKAKPREWLKLTKPLPQLKITPRSCKFAVG